MKSTQYVLPALVAVVLALTAFSVQAAPTTSYYVYDESGHVIGEYDANGNPIQEHIYLGDRPVAVVQNGNATTLDYVTTDQLNTPRAITDSSQTVDWSWTSDPFGNGQPTGSLTYNLRFPGQYYDAETGHNYNMFRDYDLSTGRYIESDPIGLDAGVNTYSYANDDPSGLSDQSGTDAIPGDGPFPPLPLPSPAQAQTAALALQQANAAAVAAFREGAENVASDLVDTLEKVQVCPKNGKCPPCTPYPAGTIGYIGPHAADHFSKYHGRNLNPHLNLFVVRQDPVECGCYWRKNWPDAEEPPPLPGWVDLNGGFPILSP